MTNSASFEQLQIFVALAEFGSLAATAREMGKTPSAVTFSIQALEEITGVVLLDRNGYRATLSPQGKQLLPRARQILNEMRLWHNKAHSLSLGQEPHLCIAIDSLFPTIRIMEVLNKFSELYPDIPLHFFSTTSATCETMLMTEKVDLSIIIDYSTNQENVFVSPMNSMKLVAVCAQNHPLAELNGPLNVDQVREFRQIILSEPTPENIKWGTRGIASPDVWRVTNLNIKKELLLEGLGWGSLPSHLAEDEISGGILKVLDLSEWGIHFGLPTLSVSLVQRKNSNFGSATKFLIDQLRCC